MDIICQEIVPPDTINIVVSLVSTTRGGACYHSDRGLIEWQGLVGKIRRGFESW